MTDIAATVDRQLKVGTNVRVELLNLPTRVKRCLLNADIQWSNDLWMYPVFGPVGSWFPSCPVLSKIPGLGRKSLIAIHNLARQYNHMMQGTEHWPDIMVK